MKPVQVYDGDGSRADIPHLTVSCNVLDINTDHRKKAKLELRFLRGEAGARLAEDCINAWMTFEIRAGDRMLLTVVEQNRGGTVQRTQEFEGILLDADTDNIEDKVRLTVYLELTP